MRVLVYDKTCVKTRGHLSPVWAVGGALYRGLGRIDATRGVTGWNEALGWLATMDEPIDEIQYWGHGTWGGAWVEQELLSIDDLADGHPRRPLLDLVRARLAPDALLWFRTCQTFGAARGQRFAEALATYLNARVAGHTYVIHFHQSGLHGLVPGQRAYWSATEGLRAGTGEAPVEARTSTPWAPHTITCLAGRVPKHCWQP